MTRLIENIPAVELSRGLVRFELISYGVDGKTPGPSEVYALTPHAAFLLARKLSDAAIKSVDQSGNVATFYQDKFRLDGGDDE